MHEGEEVEELSLKVGYTAAAQGVQTIWCEKGIGADAVGWCSGQVVQEGRLMKMISTASGICVWCEADVEMMPRIY